MKKDIDYIGFDKDGRFDLESFTNSVFERIKALVVVIAYDSTQTSRDEEWALIEILREEVLEVESNLRKWIDESIEPVRG